MAWNTHASKVANRKFSLIEFFIFLAMLAPPGPAFAATGDMWPDVRVPPQVETFDVGQEMVVNGTRARIRGFISHAAPSELVASFRRLLGQPLMEDRRGNKLILGRGEGKYYVTVQLDPLGSGTRGVIAVTKPPVDGEEAADLASARRLLSALPPGSRLASHTSSVDGGIHAEHDAIVNDHSVGINSEYVRRMLRADGFILERESGQLQPIGPGRRARSDARTLFFKRPDGEATAVFFRDDNGNSVVVLNRARYGGLAK
jgi:hypothetical protein